MSDKICSICGGGLLNILMIPSSEALDVLILGIIGGGAGLIGNLINGRLKDAKLRGRIGNSIGKEHTLST